MSRDLRIEVDKKIYVIPTDFWKAEGDPLPDSGTLAEFEKASLNSTTIKLMKGVDIHGISTVEIPMPINSFKAYLGVCEKKSTSVDLTSNNIDNVNKELESRSFPPFRPGEGIRFREGIMSKVSRALGKHDM